MATSGVPATVSRALKRLVDVRDDEIPTLLWSFLDFFGLLAGNYAIRPVRDEMGVAGGVKNLPGMFLGTLVAMLAVAAVASRLGKKDGRPSLRPLYRLLQANLLLFLVVPRLLPATIMPWVARSFFVWASVYNLFVVSVVWGAMAARFRPDQARRLFGFLAAGGTLGAICGSAVAAGLAPRVGPMNLLIAAIAFLEIALFAARRAVRDGGAERPEPIPPSPGRPGRTLASPFLMGLAGNVFLFTITSACVYLEQARIVEATFADPADRTAFFARIDLLVNLAGLAVQVLLTGRILATLGVGGSAALLPMVTLIGFVALGARPSLGVLLAFQVARRATDYAVARPTREILYASARRGSGLGPRRSSTRPSTGPETPSGPGSTPPWPRCPGRPGWPWWCPSAWHGSP